MPKYKLIALDLDGTLLNNRGKITAVTADAVLRAQRAGVTVALCTGRNLTDARVFSNTLPSPADWAVTANGADVRPMAGGDAVFSDGLNDALCQEILKICTCFDSDPCFYTNNGMYYGEEFRKFVFALHRRGVQADFLEIESYHYVENAQEWEQVLRQEHGCITKAILHHEEPKVVDCITDALRQTGLFELAPSAMFGGQLKNVEVNRRGVSKGRALEVLAAHIGCGMEQVLAIGDSDNDLSMLRLAGVGVAMANADPHIRNAVDAVTAANTEDGVARAIERYILEETL